MKCDYCGKKAEEKFCSKECKDNQDSAKASNEIKGAVMDKMREMAKGDKEREIKFLKSITTCLKLDLEERQKR